VITFSALRGPAKTQLLETAELLGIKALPDVTEECTHLVMSNLKVTIKAIQAVSYGCHIGELLWLSFDVTAVI
jgi:hypothetical protein